MLWPNPAPMLSLWVSFACTVLEPSHLKPRLLHKKLGSFTPPVRGPNQHDAFSANFLTSGAFNPSHQRIWWASARWAAHSQHSLESRRTSSCLHVAAMYHSVTHSQENQEPLLPFPSTNSTDPWGEIKSHPTRSCLVILAVFFKSPSFNLSSPSFIFLSSWFILGLRPRFRVALRVLGQFFFFCKQWVSPFCVKNI